MPADAFDMVVAHRAFRREFDAMPELIDAVRTGDVDRAKVVSDHFTFMVAALHHHHAAEDDMVWPKLKARVPSHRADVDRMLDEHTEIATAIHRIETLIPGWASSADPKSQQELSAAAGQLAQLVRLHLDDEERNAVPLIEEHLTQKEWAAAIKRAASFISVRNLRLGIVLGGLVLDIASEQERRMILDSAPLPQRLLVQAFGARTLAAYRRRLYART